MAIRVRECRSAAGGCLIAFVPDADEAALFLARACRVFGWSMGRPSGPDAAGTLIAFVRGATAAGFRSEFAGMPEFDFASCEEDTFTDRAGPEGEGTVVVGPPG